MRIERDRHAIASGRAADQPGTSLRSGARPVAVRPVGSASRYRRGAAPAADDLDAARHGHRRRGPRRVADSCDMAKRPAPAMGPTRISLTVLWRRGTAHCWRASPDSHGVRSLFTTARTPGQAPRPCTSPGRSR